MRRLLALLVDRQDEDGQGLVVDRQDEDGQGLAEYALILALIAIVAIIALIFLGNQVSEILSSVGTSV